MERTEAIEVIRKNYPHVGFSGTEFETALRELVPELEENEDERVRKFLIGYFSELVDENSEWGLTKETRDKIVAYLKKQKELSELEQLAKLREMTNEIREAYERGIEVGRAEQNPAEWSEKDEEKLNWICECIRDYPRLAKFREECYGEFAEYADWVESNLRPQPHWKPSEEQMKWLKDVIETVPMTCRQQVPLESIYADLQKLL